MNASVEVDDEFQAEPPAVEALGGDVIPLSDPDITIGDIAAVEKVLRSSRLSSGPVMEAFEAAFAAYLGRKYAVAAPSGTMGLLLALAAYEIGPGDEVIASPHSFRETVHAIALAGAKPVFADIDYWSGVIASSKIEALITDKTRAIVGSNTNGHPAQWAELREIANRRRLILLEDSTEAIGSKYKGALVGAFGDAAVFDFSQPGPLVCGEGGMVVTDDIDVAVAMRRFRAHRPSERASVVVGSSAPYQSTMSDMSAALGLAQLRRLDEILEKRKLIEHYYFKHIKSFEGIKDPFIAP
ncbi:MAG TPA: DegT/DnrJ/EryC1/StrS family aminotransferase, partial [Methylocystis sp.]